jgi:hypothetical protein
VLGRRGAHRILGEDRITSTRLARGELDSPRVLNKRTVPLERGPAEAPSDITSWGLPHIWLSGGTMWKPPWWWWLQIRDLVPVIVCVLLVAGFLYLSAVLAAHLVNAVMGHIRHALNHP